MNLGFYFFLFFININIFSVPQTSKISTKQTVIIPISDYCDCEDTSLCSKCSSSIPMSIDEFSNSDIPPLIMNYTKQNSYHEYKIYTIILMLIIIMIVLKFYKYKFK